MAETGATNLEMLCRSAKDSDRVALLPLTIRSVGDQCLLLRMDTGAMVRTSSLGAEAVRLLRKGNSIGRVKAVLGEKYGFRAENVDLTPLLHSLAVKDLIVKIGEEPLLSRLDPVWTRKWRSASRALAARSIAFAIRYVPLSSLLPLLYEQRQERSPQMLARVEGNLGRAPGLRLPAADRRRVAQLNCDLLLRTHIDRLLVSTVPPRRLREWFEEYMTVEGGAGLEEAVRSGKRVVLCGFHTGSYSLLPFLLAAKGYPVTALIHAAKAEQQTAEQTVVRLAKAGLGHDLALAYGSLGVCALSRALDAGRAVLILPDAFVANAGHGVPVDFLGVNLRPSTGLEWLCRSREVEVFPVYLQTAPDGRYRLIIDQGISVQPDRPQDAITKRVYSVLEKVVADAPEQWLRWKDLDNMVSN
ncbi:MAG: lysophospholipid acyltransferase family protein [Bryobacteraceae bacterium]